MTVYPLTFHLGPISLTGFGVMMMVAFLFAGWTMQLELRRRGLDEEYAADIIIAAVVGGLVGAKLWYFALTGEALFTRAGLVWYGGFLGGVLGVMFNSWRKRVPIRFTAELVAPALALGYALGRVGCFLVQDDYGVPTTLPWGLKFPAGLPATTVENLMRWGIQFPPGTNRTDVVAVHPTEIYETLIMLVVFAWLWRKRIHQHAVGWLFACYVALAGVERFAVEFLRAKDDRLRWLGGFSLAQAASLGMMVAGVYLLIRWNQPSASGDPTTTLIKKPAAASS